MFPPHSACMPVRDCVCDCCLSPATPTLACTLLLHSSSFAFLGECVPGFRRCDCFGDKVDRVIVSEQAARAPVDARMSLRSRKSRFQDDDVDEYMDERTKQRYVHAIEVHATAGTAGSSDSNHKHLVRAVLHRLHALPR